jgi:hypothetical protein
MAEITLGVDAEVLADLARLSAAVAGAREAYEAADADCAAEVEDMHYLESFVRILYLLAKDALQEETAGAVKEHDVSIVLRSEHEHAPSLLDALQELGRYVEDYIDDAEWQDGHDCWEDGMLYPKGHKSVYVDIVRWLAISEGLDDEFKADVTATL